MFPYFDYSLFMHIMTNTALVLDFWKHILCLVQGLKTLILISVLQDVRRSRAEAEKDWK